MKLKDLVKNSDKLTAYDFKAKLNRLVRENYKYKNLGPKNRKIVLDLINKNSSNIRRGLGISAYTIRAESYKLYQKREKLKLSEHDLKDIKQILRAFKK